MAHGDQERWTVLRLLDWTKGHFGRRGVDSPRLAAEVLLGHALNCQRVMLYARFDYQPTPAELSAFRELVRRAAEHEPVAYLVGHKEFYSLTFRVTPDVLVPRAETEILVAEAVGHLRTLGRPGIMWDVCTGCGCVAVATAHQVPDVRVLATDICAKALAVAEENVRRHGLAERVRCRQADLLALPKDCADLEDFDVIAGNPPYVANGHPVGETVRREPRIAVFAGPDGMALLGPTIRSAAGLLRAGGKLILEFGYDQADSVRDAIAATGAYDEPKILCDHQEIERVAVAARRG
ncbi:MAG: hypothetical protein AMK72_11080 [Planctomycetes bacterium SM23_25]|nr:MAG: hypothetical protein AMK72_11080 [Planctomycetes bacterium SM23_25]